MARPRQGIGFAQNGTVYTGIRTRENRRITWPVAETDPPPTGVPLGVAWAKAVSLARQGAYERGEWVPRQPATTGPEPATPAAETLEDYAKRWCSDREARGLSTVDDDRGRLRKYVLPALGSVPVREVTTAQLEALVERLDAGARAGEHAWKTAVNVWTLVTKMFADACRAKTRALRVRSDNPARDVPGPDRGGEKAKQYLYPSEFLALVSCTRVPLRWRRLFALAVYTYRRARELAALSWDDIDLEHGTVLVHQAVKRRTGLAGTTKGKNARRMTLEPAVLPLLHAMHREADGKGPLLVLPSDKERMKLRRYLAWAGVTRAELFVAPEDPTRKRITFHDLRATGITWMAVRGDDPIKIQYRALHDDFDTTQNYIREAEAVREGFGRVFPPLPAELLGGFVTDSVTDEGPTHETLVFHRQNGHPRRDSHPLSRD